jgi:hypothetical protein
MLPSGECFEADHPTGRGVCERRVVEDHLTPSDPPAKIGSLDRVAQVQVPQRAVGVDPSHDAEHEEDRRFVDRLDDSGMAPCERPDEEHGRSHNGRGKPSHDPVHHCQQRDRDGSQQHDSRIGHLEAQCGRRSTPTAAAMSSADRDIRTLTITRLPSPLGPRPAYRPGTGVGEPRPTRASRSRRAKQRKRAPAGPIGFDASTGDAPPPTIPHSVRLSFTNGRVAGRRGGQPFPRMSRGW